MQVRQTLIIPLAAAGMIVGKQGKTIKMINTKTGANAALAKDPLESDKTRKELVIKGTRAQVHTTQHTEIQTHCNTLQFVFFLKNSS